MDFKDIIGHDRQLLILQNAIANRKLAHGYLFDGRGGIGKKQVAFALAKTMLCGKGVVACGLCPSCIQFDSENHPDYLYIEPDGLSIKDKQLEVFQSFVQLKPFESDTKVVVVDQADLMTVRAQNRILKVIEEPPGHVLILFITENKEALLPTVLSRLQLLSFNRIPPSAMETWLIQCAYDPESAHLAALYADGSLGMAIKLLSSPDFYQMREAALSCLVALHEGDTLKAFERIDPYMADKVSTISFMDLMIIWYRDTLLLKIHPNSPLRFTKEVTETFLSLSKFVETQRVPFYIEIVEAAKKAIGANANHPLVAEAMLLKLTGGQI
jgi:DNA polymerase-3 subunit delta'